MSGHNKIVSCNLKIKPLPVCERNNNVMLLIVLLQLVQGSLLRLMYRMQILTDRVKDVVRLFRLWNIITLSVLAFITAVASNANAQNIKIATFNVQQLPDITDNDYKYYDDNGNPLSDEARARLIADRIRKSDVEIIALNEVFDENSREIFINALKSDFPWYVAYIGNDTDIEDSGLMLFSRYHFEPMNLNEGHIPDDGDVLIGRNGNESENPSRFIGFIEFECDPAYIFDLDILGMPILDPAVLGIPMVVAVSKQVDCVSTKGAGIVAINIPGNSDPDLCRFYPYDCELWRRGS